MYFNQKINCRLSRCVTARGSCSGYLWEVPPRLRLISLLGLCLKWLCMCLHSPKQWKKVQMPHGQFLTISSLSSYEKPKSSFIQPQHGERNLGLLKVLFTPSVPWHKCSSQSRVLFSLQQHTIMFMMKKYFFDDFYMFFSIIFLLKLPNSGSDL